VAAAGAGHSLSCSTSPRPTPHDSLARRNPQALAQGRLGRVLASLRASALGSGPGRPWGSSWRRWARTEQNRPRPSSRRDVAVVLGRVTDSRSRRCRGWAGRLPAGGRRPPHARGVGGVGRGVGERRPGPAGAGRPRGHDLPGAPRRPPLPEGLRDEPPAGAPPLHPPGQGPRRPVLPARSCGRAHLRLAPAAPPRLHGRLRRRAGCSTSRSSSLARPHPSRPSRPRSPPTSTARRPGRRPPGQALLAPRPGLSHPSPGRSSSSAEAALGSSAGNRRSHYSYDEARAALDARARPSSAWT
jgi:hypothetical protein